MKLPNAITRVVARQALISQKNAPHLLFGVGVAGMIGSTVLACRATLKLNELVEEQKNDLAIAHSITDARYTPTDRRKDVTIIYTRSVSKVARLYAPSVLLGVASVGALTKSHSILHERNVALTAAYAAVDKAFRQYRERVKDKYGEEEDREFRFPHEDSEIRGQDTDQRFIIQVLSDAHEESMYARFFDMENPNWNVGIEYNTLFLQCQQKYANDKLKARGHVFLNEVYDMLGMERTQPGAVVGWILNNREGGDNHISFGCLDENDQIRTDINGRNGSLLLDFNVDGVIWDKIDDEERIPWQT